MFYETEENESKDVSGEESLKEGEKKTGEREIGGDEGIKKEEGKVLAPLKNIYATADEKFKGKTVTDLFPEFRPGQVCNHHILFYDYTHAFYIDLNFKNRK